MEDFCNLIVIDLSGQKPAAGHKDITSITAEQQDVHLSPTETRLMWTPRDQQVSDSGQTPVFSSSLSLCSCGVLLVVRCETVNPIKPLF